MGMSHDLLQDIISKINLPEVVNQPFFIAISGAAASGKTTIANALSATISLIKEDLSIVVLSLDGFMLSRQKRQSMGISGYDPRSHDIAKIKDAVTQLSKGKTIDYYPYNHFSGRHDISPVQIGGTLIILDGIYSFHEVIEKTLNYKIFISGEKDTLKSLRLKVDIEKRKYTDLEAYSHSETEYINYEKFIVPYKQKADLVIKVESNWKFSFS